MIRDIHAVYEKGVFRLLDPVQLADNTPVTLTIQNGSDATDSDDFLDQEFHSACAKDADFSISLEEVRAALSKIPGPMTDDFIAERDEM